MEAAAATDDGPDAKRDLTNDIDEAPKGTMPNELRATIEASLAAIGTVEYHRRPHRKGPDPATTGLRARKNRNDPFWKCTACTLPLLKSKMPRADSE